MSMGCNTNWYRCTGCNRTDSKSNNPTYYQDFKCHECRDQIERWILVTDHLPMLLDKPNPVITYQPKSGINKVAWYGNFGGEPEFFVYNLNGPVKLINVTHWMPDILPPV